MPIATHTRSILLLLLTMTVWGSTFAVTKELVAVWPPFTVAFARVAVGALVLLPLAMTRRRPGERLPWLTIWIMGAIGVTFYYVAFNLALVYSSASQGALVQASIPAMVALVAVLWLRERATALRWLGIALSVGGVLIVFAGTDNGGANDGSSVLGNGLMFASVVCWAFYTSLAKRVAHLDAIVITTFVMGVGAVMLLPLSIHEVLGSGLRPLPTVGWFGLIYLGVVASGLAYALYNSSLKALDASAVGVYTNLIPIVGVLTGVVVLGEPLSIQAVIGGVVVLVGVWLTGRPERRPATASM